MSPAPLYSERGGQGPPLVLLHGWAMNLRVFDALRSRLEPHYAVTAIDLPGHGRSPWASDWSAAAQLEQIAAALPESVTLVGWSLGGQLALQLAARRRSPVRQLVLIATTPRFVRSEDWRDGMDPETLERFAGELERDAEATVADFLELQVRGSRSAAELLQTLRHGLREHGGAQPAALRGELQLLRDQDLRALARTLCVPTLVIAGQYDRVTPPAAGEALAGLLPRGRYLELARAGHAPFLSHLEEVVSALAPLAARPLA